jgi:hypothetical protein
VDGFGSSPPLPHTPHFTHNPDSSLLITTTGVAEQQTSKENKGDSSELIAANQVPCSNIYNSSNTTTPH